MPFKIATIIVYETAIFRHGWKWIRNFKHFGHHQLVGHFQPGSPGWQRMASVSNGQYNGIFKVIPCYEGFFPHAPILQGVWDPTPMWISIFKSKAVESEAKNKNKNKNKIKNKQTKNTGEIPSHRNRLLRCQTMHVFPSHFPESGQ